MKSTLLLVLSFMAIGAHAQTEVTVYNGGFAFVKQIRELNFAKAGVQNITLEEVAQMIDPTSVAIRSVSEPGSFVVLEQSYRYDLISYQAILAKATGQKIWFNRVLPNGERERLEGTLLSAPYAIIGNAGGGNNFTYNGMIVQTADGRILLNPSGEIEVSSIPGELIAKPSLVWMLDAQKAGRNSTELSYLTNGMRWEASYVLSLDRDGKVGALKGWVTLDNNSGTTFQDAKLKLLAGDVRRVQDDRALRSEMMAKNAAPGGTRGGFEQESFADYHLYTLQRPTTLNNKEIKQVSLLEAINIPVKRQLTLNLGFNAYGEPSDSGYATVEGLKPQIRLEIKNSKDANLGMPLPMGKVKAYQRDSSESLQMIGEDRIDHTPKDETIKLEMGTAFDVVGTFKRMSYEPISSGNRRVGAVQTFSLELRNRKDTADTVRVMDQQFGKWTVRKSNHPHTKPDAATLQFEVALKPNETKTIEYTVETRW